MFGGRNSVAFAGAVDKKGEIFPEMVIWGAMRTTVETTTKAGFCLIPSPMGRVVGFSVGILEGERFTFFWMIPIAFYLDTCLVFSFSWSALLGSIFFRLLWQWHQDMPRLFWPIDFFEGKGMKGVEI